MLVGTITDDKRLFELPKLRVVAMRFTETARARILKVSTEHWACHGCLPQSVSVSFVGACWRCGLLMLDL